MKIVQTRAHLSRDQPVQPRGVDVVVLKLGRLQELHQVLDRGADLTLHLKHYVSHSCSSVINNTDTHTHTGAHLLEREH